MQVGLVDEKTRLPFPQAPQVVLHPRQSIYRTLLLTLALCSCIGFTARHYATTIANAFDLYRAAPIMCPQADLLIPQRHSRVSQALSDVLATEGFQTQAIEWLSKAVQIPTEMYDDMPPVGQDPRWDVFSTFHDYLAFTFPRVHDKLSLTKVNTYGLLYQWNGSDSSLKPILVTAHQDVVPVEPLTWKDWKHPPFSGYYDGEFIWGRGSADDKSGLISVLGAIELLLEQGFSPSRTVVLAFGFDEEAFGFRGAGTLGPAIEELYGSHHPFAFVIDEGGGFDGDLVQGVFATPAIAEKGFINVQLELTSPGGHSSTIGMLAALVVKYEDKPFPLHLHKSRDSVTYQTLQCRGEHTRNIPKDLKQAIKRSIHSDDALHKLESIIFRDKTYRALVGTTAAVDIMHGGVKSNALPEQAIAIINHRISTESSVAETMAYDTALLQDLAEKFNLTYTAFGTLISVPGAPAYGALTVTDAHGTALEPAPVTRFAGPGSEAYELLSGTIKAVFNAHRNLDDPSAITVAPAHSTGNTDTRHYWNLSRNIFRYNHRNSMGRDRLTGAHTVNEGSALLADGLFEMIRFYATLILNADESTVI
ncbi:unnamed protein product [Mycena citricolor]|uniref:Peptidase M20 dimerisation domain-containing protein n=1 Tax=Mycena citricolor TaxID=2018698 RepID=A0AAD2HUD9_9AGAR|nr:unnamed protein product [Mycena citricolor]